MPSKKHTALACALIASALFAPTALARSPVPSPDCMDARLISEARQPGPRTLLVLGSDNRRFRIDLESDCPSALQGEGATLLANEGWVCGKEREFVRKQGQICRVAAIRGIDTREYAELARSSDRQEQVVTLDAVEVRSGQRRGFAGSFSYCFSPRHMRGWSEDPESLIVEMSPKRSGGNRYYRVELAHNCPALDSSPVIEFRSGMGIGLICGNPGDRVVAIPEEGGFSSRGITRFSCEVSAVYPLQSRDSD